MKILGKNGTIGYFCHTDQAVDDATGKERKKKKDKIWNNMLVCA